jgi:tRNA (Thr-GGU) A37 N-methylase
LSIVTLLGRSGNVLRVGEIDVDDQTPLLDIKPYVPQFDAPQASALGWLEGKAENFREKRSDHRFLK